MSSTLTKKTNKSEPVVFSERVDIPKGPSYISGSTKLIILEVPEKKESCLGNKPCALVMLNGKVIGSINNDGEWIMEASDLNIREKAAVRDFAIKRSDAIEAAYRYTLSCG